MQYELYHDIKYSRLDHWIGRRYDAPSDRLCRHLSGICRFLLRPGGHCLRRHRIPADPAEGREQTLLRPARAMLPLPSPGLSSRCWLPSPTRSPAEIPSYIDAVFEMVSGFTTTGASILPDVEALSRSMLFWRSIHPVDRRHGRPSLSDGGSAPHRRQLQLFSDAGGKPWTQCFQTGSPSEGNGPSPVRSLPWLDHH